MNRERLQLCELAATPVYCDSRGATDAAVVVSSYLETQYQIEVFCCCHDVSPFQCAEQRKVLRISDRTIPVTVSPVNTVFGKPGGVGRKKTARMVRRAT
jgi:hypothetical protein